MQILILMLSHLIIHHNQGLRDCLPDPSDHFFCTEHKKTWKSMKTKQPPRNPWWLSDSSTIKLCGKALWSTVSCAATVAILSGFILLPAAPAICSSTLSRSSHAAGWMSPYISSVRIGAALISSDKGAGERLITCKKPSHALQLSSANYPQWATQ